MPRRCAICDRSDRAEIDHALTSHAQSYRRIASRCNVSDAAVRRHAANHIPDAIAAALEQQQAQIVVHGGSLLNQVHDLHARALALLTAAETGNDRRAALAAIREARSCIELLARLQGQLADRSATQVNVVIGADWVRLRTVILTALTSFPEARGAVSGALANQGGP